MINKARRTIKKYGMLKKGDRVGIAVSGGPDSVALLNVLRALSREYGLMLVVIHLNHGLRGEESDGEEEFVKEMVCGMGITLESRKIDIPDMAKKRKGSLEDICRDERYRFFEEVFKEHGLNKIALGHNLDDQAETIVMKFLRGSALGGLRGMLPVREEKYIRPLIEVSREEILAFLKDKNAKYTTDSSNLSNVYLRNRIRNNLIPELERSYNPKLKSTLCRMSYVLRTENDFMESCAKEVLSKWNIDPCNMCANIEIPAFVKLHPALRFRVAKKVLETYTLSKRETDYAHVRSIVDLAEGRRPNGSVNLPSGVVAKRDYDILTVSREENRFCECGSQGKDDKTKMNDYCYRVNVPGTVEIKEAGIKVRFEATGAEDVDFSLRNAVFIGRENISFPLFLRNIKPGDRIEPLGMKGTKKVSRFFIDRKISKGDRKKIPLLSDGRSILWIVGMQLSAVARVDHTTKEVIKAEII